MEQFSREKGNIFKYLKFFLTLFKIPKYWLNEGKNTIQVFEETEVLRQPNMIKFTDRIKYGKSGTPPEPYTDSPVTTNETSKAPSLLKASTYSIIGLVLALSVK